MLIVFFSLQSLYISCLFSQGQSKRGADWEGRQSSPQKVHKDADEPRADDVLVLAEARYDLHFSFNDRARGEQPVERDNIVTKWCTKWLAGLC